MRAGLVTGKEQFELREVAEPTPGPGEALVEISLCGICGSDVHAYAEGWPYAPGICGHEWVGTVVAVDAEVRVVGMGDRVTGGLAPGCGRCPECRADHPAYCSVARSYYIGENAPVSGGFAPFMAASADRLVRVPEALSNDDAAVIEPVSVALHAVRRSRLQPGDVACVVGCGPIGLLVAQCARLAGAGTVIAVEPDAERRALALELGVDAAVAPGAEMREAVNEATDGLRADIAFDCAGIPQTIQQSADMVRFGGSVCIVGVTGSDATIRPNRWLFKEISVDTSLAFTLDEMRAAAGFIADGRISVAPLVQGTVTLDELPQTIDDLATRRNTSIKLLVDPTAG
ncbi:MAG: zinc-binding dehydrogenase [Acidimicrobiales bacterium]|nr:zinc-binding dehydrogenase [Acidimicrobiales bacterium]MYH74825.1 zinc-binding dehydrogenase [Acidimicrobiales bacterium]MYK70391.1 zinc-binding dehydrogenase [Acidimicrobiales bacterium]